MTEQTVDLPDDAVVDETPGAEVAEVPKIAHPKTGEIVEVVKATATDVLAEARDAFVVRRSELDAAARVVDRELAARLDYEGRRSGEIKGAAGHFKLSVVAPTKTEWDGERAYRALRGLVRQGLISADRAREAVTREVSYKPNHGSLKQLLAHADERVRDAVEACRDEVEVTSRRVTVTRKA